MTNLTNTTWLAPTSLCQNCFAKGLYWTSSTWRQVTSVSALEKPNVHKCTTFWVSGTWETNYLRMFFSSPDVDLSLPLRYTPVGGEQVCGNSPWWGSKDGSLNCDEDVKIAKKRTFLATDWVWYTKQDVVDCPTQIICIWIFICLPWQN